MFCKLPGELHQHSCAVQRSRVLLLALAPLKRRGEESSKFSDLCGDEEAVMKAPRATSSIMNTAKGWITKARKVTCASTSVTNINLGPDFAVISYSAD